MDFPQNTSNNNQPGGVVPPPPQAEVNVRTMQSDVKSMQEQGGSAPVPQQVSPSEIAFKPEEIPASHSSKKIWWLLIILIIVALGAGAYYYYFMMGNQITPTTENVATETSQSTEEAPAMISLANLTAALKIESEEVLPLDNFKEIALVNEEGRALSFFNVLSVILPELNGTELANTIKNNFKDEFQSYLYYDENGVWPIYKVSLKDNSSIDTMTLRAQLMSMENASVGNFYIDPLGLAVAFKDGQVNSFPTRYSSFPEKPGASFNYGLINSDLYLSTSYQGLKKVLESY